MFEVLKWQSLEKEISIAETGPNPISYTNFFLLTNSSTYSELLLRNEADYRFFTELKRRTDKAIIDGSNESTVFEFGDAKVLFGNTNIYVYNNGKPVELCTVQDFSRRPNAAFRRLQKYQDEISRHSHLNEDKTIP